MTTQPAFQPCEWASCRDAATTRSAGYAFCQDHAREDFELHSTTRVGPKPCTGCGGFITRPTTTHGGAWPKRCALCKTTKQHPPANTQEAH